MTFQCLKRRKQVTDQALNLAPERKRVFRKALSLAAVLAAAAIIPSIAVAGHASSTSACTPTVSKVVRSGDAFAGAGSDACSGKVRVVIRAWVRSVGHWVDQASASGPGNNTVITASGFCRYAGKSSDSRAWQTWSSWSGSSGNYKTNSVNDTLLCVPLHS